ncbi:MAG: hypothetical protein MZW92_03530 [Comamonadaceae bacterium]|nr:hypothetical protein [Comamonadaceae bacterium]
MALRGGVRLRRRPLRENPSRPGGSRQTRSTSYVRASWKADGTWARRPDAFSSHRAGFRGPLVPRRCRRAPCSAASRSPDQDRLAPSWRRALPLFARSSSSTKISTIR